MPDGTGDRSGQAKEPCPFAELPSPDVKRWTIRRKASVVIAVVNGLLTRREACRRYHLSGEEFLHWQQMHQTYGLPGLRVTRGREYQGKQRST
ncbi:MAG: DUF1153 domain-containing protein [Stellaceae bacterium]